MGLTVSPAVAARVRQLAAQAEHHRAIAEYRAHHAIDQQQRINAMLLELIDALASLVGIQRSQADPAPASSACRTMNTEHSRIMCKQRGRYSLPVQNEHVDHLICLPRSG